MTIARQAENDYQQQLTVAVIQYWNGAILPEQLAEKCLPEDYQTACALLAETAANSAKVTWQPVDRVLAGAIREMSGEIGQLHSSGARQQLRATMIVAGLGLVRDTRNGIGTDAKGELEKKVASFQAAMELRYER